MKNLLFYLFLLPFIGILTSCDNDEDDLPDVNIKIVMSGGTQDPSDNSIHVPQGTPLVIESLSAEPRNGKEAVLGLTTYYINGIPQFQTITPPFAATIHTSTLVPGKYQLQIRTSVYQVDKSAAVCVLTFNMIVDTPSSDNPEEPATFTIIKSGEETLSEK